MMNESEKYKHSFFQLPKLTPVKTCRGFDSPFPLTMNSLAHDELGSFLCFNYIRDIAKFDEFVDG